MSDLKLYSDSFWISPYGFSVYVALREKELPFEYVPVSLPDREQDRLRDRGLTGKVPALEHGDFWLAESSAIVEYLDEAFPAPRHARVLPEGLRERARARQIMAWIRSDLMALREERPTTSMFYAATDKPMSPACRIAADKLVRVAEQLIPDGATTLFGAFSIADADLAFCLHRLILNGDPVPPRVRAFAEAVWKRPSVRGFVEQKRLPYRPY